MKFCLILRRTKGRICSFCCDSAAVAIYLLILIQSDTDIDAATVADVVSIVTDDITFTVTPSDAIEQCGGTLISFASVLSDRGQLQ